MPWRSFLLNVPLACLSVGLLGVTSVWAQDSLPWPGADYEPLSPATQPTTRPAQPTAQPLSPLGQNDAYVLGTGDQIQVDIFTVPELSASYRVLVDGTLSIPLIGVVNVQGLTLTEITDLLTQRYSTILTRPPEITVTLQAPRPVRVVVAGEVRRPGAYTIRFEGSGASSLDWPTLTQLIRQSGGITEQADIRKIEVVRPQRSGNMSVLQVNLWDLIQAGDLEQDIRLRDGDRILVPVATALPEDFLRIATSNFAPEAIIVQVVGEVPRGGNVTLPVNATLNQAILAAGGLDNPRIQSSSVDLVRLNQDGTVLRETYTVDLSAAPNDANNPVLRSNDVVLVPRNDLARSSDFLRVLTAPVVGVLGLLNLFGISPFQ
jgi:polysaccharide export outer membrane protein